GLVEDRHHSLLVDVRVLVRHRAVGQRETKALRGRINAAGFIEGPRDPSNTDRVETARAVDGADEIVAPATRVVLADERHSTSAGLTDRYVGGEKLRREMKSVDAILVYRGHHGRRGIGRGLRERGGGAHP